MKKIILNFLIINTFIFSNSSSFYIDNYIEEIETSEDFIYKKLKNLMQKFKDTYNKKYSEEDESTIIQTLKDFLNIIKTKTSDQLDEENKEFVKQIYIITESEINKMKNDAKIYFDEDYDLYAKAIIGEDYFEENKIIEYISKFISEKIIYINNLDEETIYSFFNNSDDIEYDEKSIKKLFDFIKEIIPKNEIKENSKTRNKNKLKIEFFNYFLKTIIELIFDKELIEKIVKSNEEKKTRIVSIMKK